MRNKVYITSIRCRFVAQLVVQRIHSKSK